LVLIENYTVQPTGAQPLVCMSCVLGFEILPVPFVIGHL
jgi:hypothetical protein